MSFQITIEPSGRQYSADAQETLLAAGIAAGIAMPYGCKDGACGSCKCKKISGQVTQGPHQIKALSPEEAAQGYVLPCCATAQSDLVLECKQVTAVGAYPVRKMPVRVAALEKLSPDVMKVVLQLPANDPMQYHAGQYIDVLLRDGSRRSYSMANAPHTLEPTAPKVELHIRHMPGGLFTDQVFSSLKEKDILRAEGPQGGFYLREDSSKPIILLASGTGFAPIKALIEHMQHKGIERPVTLYWGGRRPHDLYLQDWVLAQMKAMPHLSYVPVVSDALAEDAWQGRSGFVHQAVLHDCPDLSGHEVYACGAPVVVESARHDYALAGLPAEAFFADAFTSAADKAAA